MAKKTYSQMRRDFYDAYRTKVVPAVRKFEKERKLRLLIACIFPVLLLFTCFLFSYSHFFVTQDNSTILKFYMNIIAKLIGTTFFISWIVIRWIKKTFENKIKEQIMFYLTSCYENLEWFNGEYYTDNLFKISNLIDSYNKEEYDDIFYGSYREVAFDIIEAKYIYKGDNYTTTVFDGVILKFDMNKNFVGNTVVKEKQIIDIENGITLEDVEFNKKYKVFTDDEVEARYLLTPSFMERIKNIQLAFSADRVDCAFYDKYLLIALHTKKDLFSLCSLLKPVDDAKQYFTMYEEIVSIIKLIDHFKLDQKIGL